MEHDNILVNSKNIHINGSVTVFVYLFQVAFTLYHFRIFSRLIYHFQGSHRFPLILVGYENQLAETGNFLEEDNPSY